MASVRLTDHIRELICKDIIDHSFGAQGKKIYADRMALANMVYERKYDTATRSKMNALPQGWLDTDIYVGVQFGEGRFNYCRLPMSKAQRFPHEDCGKTLLRLEATDDLAVEHERISQVEAAWKSETAQRGAEVKAILNSVSTMKQLLDTWPEVKPFCESRIPADNRTTALAPRLHVLNAQLGLVAQP